MEKRRFAERLPDPRDRCGTLIRFTEKGKETIDKALAPHIETEARPLGALSKDEQTELADLMKKLTPAREKTD